MASLPGFLRDIGYVATSSSHNLKVALNHGGFLNSGMLNEESVALALIMMGKTVSGLGDFDTLPEISKALFSGMEDSDFKKYQTWDVEVFAATILSVAKNLDWMKVLQYLDHPEFYIAESKSLAVILNSSKVAFKDLSRFPTKVFLGEWKHVKGQFSFLKNAIQFAPDLFGPSYTPRRVVTDTVVVPAVAKPLLVSISSQPWNSLDLIQTLMLVTEKDAGEETKAFFEFSFQQSPELILLGLAQLPVPWSALHKEFASNLVMMFLVGHPNSGAVLPLLWQFNQPLTLAGLVHLYTKEPSLLSRVLDIAQEIKALPQFLEAKPFSFAIDLAALASRRDYLNLEKWLQDRIRLDGNAFVRACLDFLSDKVSSQSRPENATSLHQSVPLSVDVVAIFLTILHSRSISLSPENSELLKEVVGACRQAYPRLANFPISQQESVISPDIGAEVEALFEKIYKGHITIPQIVEILKKFRDSTNKREADIYSYFINVLFEESKNCLTDYPDKHLYVTSVLFGALIQNVIVVTSTLMTALTFVLEALRQPIGSKLFKFGSQALLQFQSRLVEWPQYSTLLLQIPHLHQAHPEIINFIRGFEGQLGTQRVDTSIPDSRESPLAGAGNGQQTIFTALRLDTLLEAADKDSFEVPQEAVQDKILFIINNVSFDNLEAKVNEMKEILRDTHFRWFSHYIVVKRSSIEPNFHDLYISFLEGLKQPSLQRNILHETYSNIKILLNSEKTLTSSSERSLLKNLGTWLGGITLAKNRPIKHKNLAFKELLLEGYDSDRLIVVIPFCCKVLEQCHSSKIFKPPNPWLMAIMKLLSELYHFAELKLNLKFEVEVLCKKIKLDIKDIAPSFILRNRQSKGIRGLQLKFSAQGEDEGGANSSAITTPSALGSSLQPSDEPQVGYPQLASYLTFNPNLPIFNAQPSLKRIVYIAIDRAIREIISPVVERSVTIASIATRELVLKDFALEPSEDRVRKSAHLMVQNLAGSLASVSSREPLRVSMMSQLRSLLLQNGYTEQSIPEQVVYIIVADNLDLACSVMEKAAAEKATVEIDENLATAYLSRRKYREQRTNQPFYDVAIYAASRYPSTLPDSLRLKPGGLSTSQLRVYEDFSRIIRTPQETSDRNSRARPDNSLSVPPYDDQSSPQIQTIVDKFSSFLSELEKLLQGSASAIFASLPPNHEIRAVIRQITTFCSLSVSRDDWLLLLTQKVVRSLYQSETQIQKDCYAALLERLLEISKRSHREFSAWFLYIDDERKLDVGAASSILKTSIVNVTDFDAHVARMIECGRTNYIEFIISLWKEMLLTETPVLSKDNFPNCFEIINKLITRGSIQGTQKDTVNDVVTRYSHYFVKEQFKDGDSSALRDKLGALFLEWVRIYHSPASNARSHVLYVFQLQQQGILGEDVSSLFFRICTELSVESYVKAKSSAYAGSPFQAVDAFAKLIVLLVRYNLNLMTNLMTKILSIVVLVLVHSHEQKRSVFNQRPFFRLFSSLLSDLDIYDEQLQPLSFQILSAMSNTFHTLQPSFLPGFTYSWIQLISHRFFMPKLLLADNSKGWPFFQRLLVDLFKFLAPFLKESEMVETTRLLYKATLRILLVLLHDFPEFLCDYHFSFVDVIPHSCIQLRNLILSAFPRNMRLPDPFTPNLKVDLLPEINQPPRVMSDYTSSLIPGNLKADIDTYLKTRAPVTFLLDLRSRLTQQPPADSTTKYNIPVINAVVLYVGVQAITQGQSKPLQGSPPITHSAPMDIFQQLIVDLDTEGKIVFIFFAEANLDFQAVIFLLVP
ncbi:hypothetical protein HDU97_009731 [Phlyctochytrium planicorne]|nr:hypothetical protein HDU97_009731 [Phlyctochytrium planicorne]